MKGFSKIKIANALYRIIKVILYFINFYANKKEYAAIILHYMVKKKNAQVFIFCKCCVLFEFSLFCYRKRIVFLTSEIRIKDETFTIFLLYFDS